MVHVAPGFLQFVDCFFPLCGGFIQQGDLFSHVIQAALQHAEGIAYIVRNA